jgi:glyoxylase-like metal-dependent hydrolase (beta-lactamase superfamily II)
VPLAIRSPDHLHVHVLDTADGELLVDCGARGSEDALLAGLRAVSADPQRVLITHAHVDHWGLASTLTDRVLAHPGVLSTLRFASNGTAPQGVNGWPEAREMHKAFAGFGDLVAGVPEVEPIADGDRLGDWTVLWTPGHDPGHVCLYRETDGVLLCGDLLLPGFTPNVQPSLDGSDALAQFLASLDRVAALPVSLVLPAHGAAYVDAAGRARQLHAHHAARLETLRGALSDRPCEMPQLRDAAFGSALTTGEDLMLAAMETYAHLEHLRRLGDANVDPEGRWTRSDDGGTRQ